jgi:hypothetical protein
MRPLAATLLLALSVLGAPVLSAQSAAHEVASADDASPQVERLRQDLAALTAAVDTTDEAPSPQLVEQLIALRREIDALLALLAARAPDVEEQADLSEGAAPETATSVASRPGPPRPSERATEPPTVPSPTPVCAEFAVFDTNADGVFSGLDRYWRYFRLWQDDGDGTIEARELSGLYDAGIQELTVKLGTYRTLEGGASDVFGKGRIRLAPGGKRLVEALLTLDADRLAGGGDLELLDRSGVPLSGVQVLTSEMTVARAGQPPAPLSCP